MRREWELEDLIECWTLDEAEFGLLANKSGATRLGFALMLKFFELEARFPRREDVPRAAVEFVAGQVKVDPGLFGEYRWSGSTIEYHRGQIREFHGFREPTVGDEDKLIVWLAGEMCPVELSRDRLREALLARCRQEKIEPPRPARIERLLGAAQAMFEREFTSATMQRLPAEVIARLEGLIMVDDADAVGGGRSFLQELKQDPGPIQLDTLSEITKLERVKAIGLPVGLFEDVSEKVVTGWRALGDGDVPLGFRRRGRADSGHVAGRAVLGAEGRDDRRSGGTAHPTGPQDQRPGGTQGGKRDQRRVPAGARQDRHLGQARRRGAGDARGDRPRGPVPVVGKQTLQDVVAEAAATERHFAIRVRTKLRGSYSHHYRRGLPKLLAQPRRRSPTGFRG